MKKILTLGLVSALLLGAGYFMTGQVSAHFGDQGVNEIHRPAFNPDRHAQMQEIIERQDYDQWLEVMGERPISEYITEENFPDFLEMMRLRHEGQFEAAEELRVLLGLPERRAHRMQQLQAGQERVEGHGFGRFYTP